MRPSLIAVTGIDGSGKSSVTRAVVPMLRHRGIPAVEVPTRGARFPQQYVQQHQQRLESLIWDPSPVAPQFELGHLHYFLLLASWFEALDRCLVRPALDRGEVVVTDGWYYKVAARANLRWRDVPEAHRRACLSQLSQPNIVFLLEIDPQVAAARKAVITRAEAGNDDGHDGRTPASFAQFQQRVREELDRFDTTGAWQTVVVDGRDVESVATEIADVCAHHLKAAADH